MVVFNKGKDLMEEHMLYPNGSIKIKSLFSDISDISLHGDYQK